jgi:hypothetical protein
VGGPWLTGIYGAGKERGRVGQSDDRADDMASHESRSTGPLLPPSPVPSELCFGLTASIVQTLTCAIWAKPN